MKQHQTFTSYLEEICLEQNPEIKKDDFEDFFNDWVMEQDINFIMQWGDMYGEQFNSNK